MQKKRGIKDIQDDGNVRTTEDVTKARAYFLLMLSADERRTFSV